MSKTIKTAAIAAISVAAFATAANAQSARYGDDIYTYEGGNADCVQNCAPVQGQLQAPAPVVGATRYGSEGVTVSPGPVYVDCSQLGAPGCAPAPAPVQQAPVIAQPQVVYTDPYGVQGQQSFHTQTVQAGPPANCPPGTTAQNDGTCLQTSSGSISYGTSTFSGNSQMGMDMADCPAGSSKQPDGSCMQTSGSVFGSTMSAEMADCPAGTMMKDGACMQVSAGTFTGDASVSAEPSYGYANDGSFGAQTYLPIRK